MVKVEIEDLTTIQMEEFSPPKIRLRQVWVGPKNPQKELECLIYNAIQDKVEENEIQEQNDAKGASG